MVVVLSPGRFWIKSQEKFSVVVLLLKVGDTGENQGRHWEKQRETLVKIKGDTGENQGRHWQKLKETLVKIKGDAGKNLGRYR